MADLLLVLGPPQKVLVRQIPPTLTIRLGQILAANSPLPFHLPLPGEHELHLGEKYDASAALVATN